MSLATPDLVRYLTQEKEASSHEEQIANARMEELIQTLLEQLGENPARNGLKDTPARVRRSWAFLTQGYTQVASEILGNALFDAEGSNLVVVRDIEMYSLCEHHLLPFYGKCHIAYLPGEKIIGLSKLPRLVEMFSRRLQVQERLTRQVAQSLEELLQPRGVAVITEAYHLCMMMRGVQKQNSSTLASYRLGAFQDNPSLYDEFIQAIRAAH